MRVWSRGLGRVELAIDLKKAKLVYKDKKLYIIGKTEPPVSWDFVMNCDAAELWRLARTVANKQGLKLVSNYTSMRLLKPGELKKRYAEATKTRTGVRPDQDYAPLLEKKSPPKEPTPVAKVVAKEKQSSYTAPVETSKPA